MLNSVFEPKNSGQKRNFEETESDPASSCTRNADLIKHMTALAAELEFENDMTEAFQVAELELREERCLIYSDAMKQLRIAQARKSKAKSKAGVKKARLLAKKIFPSVALRGPAAPLPLAVSDVCKI